VGKKLKLKKLKEIGHILMKKFDFVLNYSSDLLE
jgi:hypothetical protein